LGRAVDIIATEPDQVANLFIHHCYYADAKQKRALRAQAFEAWESVMRAPMPERLAA
jgi:putative transposase